ncbi:hypothetical protein N0V82_005961 [Gnomoniopsis sp. IMI 355080]|nr:hypothetical protein N0V82_005961 [Gnomoniopsis sp. IMI 355080]
MDATNTRAPPRAVPQVGVQENSKCEDKENVYPKTIRFPSKGHALKPRVLKRQREDRESTSRENISSKSQASKRLRQDQEDTDSDKSSDEDTDSSVSSDEDEDYDDEDDDEYDDDDEEEVDVRVDETQKLRDDINNWWRGLPTNWAQMDPLALHKAIEVCKKAERTAESGSNLPVQPRRGRPRKAAQKFYCPHCTWLKNQTSKTGDKGRQGNARQGCNYKLSAEEQVICRAEDALFVLRTLIRALAKASFKAKEKAERKAKKKAEKKDRRKAEKEAERKLKKVRKAMEAKMAEEARRVRQESVESEEE